MRFTGLSRTKKGLAVSLATGFIGCLIFPTGFGLALEEELGLSWLFRLRGPIAPPDDVVVIVLDEQSIAQLEQAPKLRDWQRSMHAQLIDKLLERNVSAIVFDVFFESAKEGDDRFAEAIRRSNRVILVQDLKHKQFGADVAVFEVDPTPQLAKAGRALAPFPLPKVPIQISRFWVFLSSAETVPTLPMAALQLHMLSSVQQEELATWLQEVGLASGEQDASTLDVSQLIRELRARLQQPGLSEHMLAYTTASSAFSEATKRMLSALIKAYSSAHSRVLNLYGPTATIHTLSYSDLWHEDVVDLDFTGKVVFVGGPPQLDGHYTVFSRGDGIDLSGVEIAATAFANLLTDTVLKQQSLLFDWLLVLVFGGTVGAVAFFLPGLYALMALSALGIAYFVSAQLLFNQYHLWVPVFTPVVVQLPIAMLVGLLVQYNTLKRAEENIARALNIYVPPEVVKRIARDRDALKPQKVYGTCLSSDVAGYTVISETLKDDPLQLTDLSREYFDLIGEAIGRHKGLMLEIAGDGLTCVWQHRINNRHRRLSACLAALDMLQAVEIFNMRHPGKQFPTRIGLQAGEVALGNMGGGPHFIYGIAGDPANTASRIEGVNKLLGTRLLADQSVVKDLDELLLRPVGRFRPLGKLEVLTLFEIVNRKSTATPSEFVLCEQFAAALALYQENDWHKACKAFQVFLDDFKEDGPASYYRRRCLEYLQSPPDPLPGPVIILDKK